MNPDTSTSENPMNDHLTKLLLADGLRDTEKTKNANIRPTPMATPVKQTIGMLEARYRKPIKIIRVTKGMEKRENERNKGLVNVLLVL
jgi:predicted transcriptional regulator